MMVDWVTGGGGFSGLRASRTRARVTALMANICHNPSPVTPPMLK
jgi:hypothetical protein